MIERLGEMKRIFNVGKVKILIKNTGGITIGKNCEIASNCDMSTKGGGSIRLGDNVLIRPYVQLLTYGGRIQIGNHCIVNQFSILYGHSGLTIGDNVLIAAHCVLIPANHQYENPEILIRQ